MKTFIIIVAYAIAFYFAYGETGPATAILLLWTLAQQLTAWGLLRDLAKETTSAIEAINKRMKQIIAYDNPGRNP